MNLLVFAIDYTNPGSRIGNGGVEINGGKAQVFSIGNSGRHDLDHGVAHPIRLVVLPDQGFVHIPTDIHNTRDLVFFDGVEKTVTGKGKDAPSIHLAVMKHTAGGNDLELGLGIF